MCVLGYSWIGLLFFGSVYLMSWTLFRSVVLNVTVLQFFWYVDYVGESVSQWLLALFTLERVVAIR